MRQCARHNASQFVRTRCGARFVARMAEQPGPEWRRVICDRCGGRSWLQGGEQRACRECGGAFRDMGLLEGLVDRWFAPPEHRASEFYPRHLKLIELMWTAHGRGQATYDALQPERVSYSQFVPRATQVVVKGLREGWIASTIPAGPTDDDDQYQVRFLDPERWADELALAFQPAARPDRADPVRVDVEGDPDLT